MIVIKFALVFITFNQIACIQLTNECKTKNSTSDSESPANWPWLVSLFYTFNDEFFCTGTLITGKHILTAAHCLSGSKFFTPASNIVASFGSKLNKTSEEIKNAVKVNFHPAYKHQDGNYNNDISILTLETAFDAKRIHPICLSNNTNHGNGKFVGYRKSKDNLNFIEIPVKNVTQCLLGDETCFIHNRSLTCDSISAGFYSQDEKLIGIFSKGVKVMDSELCGVNSFIVFTFIDDYLSWINETVNQPELERKGKDLKVMKIQGFCDYKWNYQQSLPLYTCIMRGLTAHSPDVTLNDNISGIHGDDDTDFDVERVHIVQSKLVYLPNTTVIGNKFQNLKNFWVENSKLKFVTRSSLKALSNLTILSFSMNEIVEIPEDSFMDLIQLEYVWIHNNKIFKLEENLFKSLEKLKVIDMRNNFIETLPMKIFENNQKLKTINFENNSLKSIKADLENLKNLKWFVLKRNKCIDANYCKALDCLKSLTQLIEVIKESC